MSRDLEAQADLYFSAGGALPFLGSDSIVKITGFEYSEFLDSTIYHHWSPVAIDWMDCAPEWQDEMDYMRRRTAALDVWPVGCLVRPFSLFLRRFQC